MIATYYDAQWNYLGSDGVDDNIVYESTEETITESTNKEGEVDWTKVQKESKNLGLISEVFVTGDKITDARILDLHPVIRGKATSFINNAKSELGISLRISEGFRSFAKQDEYYSQGRTTPGDIVTNAKGGQSYHNYGLAFDIVGLVKGKATWDLNWNALGNLGKASGLEWGGDWKFQDKPHFQLTFGYSYKQLLKMYNEGGNFVKIP